MFVFGKYLSQVSWEEETYQHKVAIAFFLQQAMTLRLNGIAIDQDYRCGGRLLSKVLWESRVEISFLDPIGCHCNRYLEHTIIYKNINMHIEIQNSNISDIDEIFRLYKVATDFQKTRFTVHWPEFDKKLVESEVSENRQWKIVIDGKIACVWATTFDDPQIWEDRNEDPSVFIHRIATNPVFRGQNLVGKIVEWVKIYAAENQKQFVRMDTVGDNPGLIGYYTKCGFDFLGLLKLKNTEGLPAHYHNATVSLFQMTII